MHESTLDNKTEYTTKFQKPVLILSSSRLYRCYQRVISWYI